jgi:LytS/YehU family sensor histidine kinase
MAAVAPDVVPCGRRGGDRLLWSVSAYYINKAVIPGWRPEGVAKMINTTLMTTWFFYTGLVCLMHAVVYAREYRTRQVKALQAARLSTEAQLQALKMELQPHFLFNAMNSVSALMNRDVKAANEMLVLISEMLQRTLEQVRTQEVTLAEEICTLRLYLQIEQIRLRDRLSIVWNTEPDTLPALVPYMLLQPIIENSVKHGIETRSGPGRIEISARRRGGWLELQVRDNGRGLSHPSPASGFGIGLSVTRERLSQLYGNKHRFTLKNAPEPEGGALVRISLPFTRTQDAGNRLQEEPDEQADSSSDRGRRDAGP